MIEKLIFLCEDFARLNAEILIFAKFNCIFRKKVLIFLQIVI